MSRIFLNNPVKATLGRIVLLQLAIILGPTLIILVLKGITDALATLGGALAYWLPTCFFMLGVGRYRGARNGTYFLAAFFVGEGLKLIISGALFLGLVVLGQFNLVYAVLGLVIAIVAFWIASFSALGKETKTWH